MVDAQEMLRELRAQYNPEAGVEEKRRQLEKAIAVVEAQYVIVKQKCEQMEEMKAQIEERLCTFDRWMKELDRMEEKEARRLTVPPAQGETNGPPPSVGAFAYS